MRKRETPIEPTDSLDQDPRFVTALARGLGVLAAFKRGDTALANQELARRTGLAKATVSRLTYTLAALGYLAYDADSGRYSLSATALGLGFTALGSFAIRDVARPFMQELADLTGASVAIGAPDLRTMVYVEHCRGASPLHIGIEVGSHIKMATSSMGRAHLAGLDAKERARLTARLCPEGGEGDAMRRGIEQAAKQYAERGYVISAGDWKSEINSVGVPLGLGTGSLAFALNCGGSSMLLPNDSLDEVGRQLAEVARKIRAALGAA